MEGKSTENMGPGLERDEKSKIVEVPRLEEFLTLQARYADAVELTDGMKELFSKCQTWIAEQNDFSTNDMKKAMVMALYEKMQNVQSKIAAELLEIELIAMDMLAKVQKIKAIREEVPHGEHPENR